LGHAAIGAQMSKGAWEPTGSARPHKLGNLVAGGHAITAAKIALAEAWHALRHAV